jgi:hypothetical protein
MGFLSPSIEGMNVDFRAGIDSGSLNLYDLALASEVAPDFVRQSRKSTTESADHHGFIQRQSLNSKL